MDGLIVELRSATAGVGSFTQRFDHLAELNGRRRSRWSSSASGGGHDVRRHGARAGAGVDVSGPVRRGRPGQALP